MDAFIQAICLFLSKPTSKMLVSSILEAVRCYPFTTSRYLGEYMTPDQILEQDVEGWDENTRFWAFKKQQASKFDPFDMNQRECLGWRFAVSQGDKFAVLGYTHKTRSSSSYKRIDILIPSSHEALERLCDLHPMLARTLFQELLRLVPIILYPQ